MRHDILNCKVVISFFYIMNDFIVQQLFFIGVTYALLIIPGWLFLNTFFARNQFALLEKFVLSVPISFALITVMTLCADHFQMSLTSFNLTSMIICTICFLLIGSIIKRKKRITHARSDIFTFSRTQTLAIAFLIILTIVIKSVFLINTIFPTATDLGHHLFWVEKIVVDHTLPTYQKIEIAQDPTRLTEPTKIPDFIIGEHIFLGVIAILTNMPVIGTFPSLVLFVINIFTALMMFIFARRLCEKYTHGTSMAILVLLFIGPLWAISGAQAKFVSGGVIGNLLGNLLIPTILYFFYRAFSEKRATLLIPAILLITTLAYTHHLSTLIFGYTFFFSLGVFVLLQKNRWSEYIPLLALFKNYYVLPMILVCLTLLFVIAPPSYLDTETIASSVGEPTKSTRLGTPYAELFATLGEARVALGIIGLFIMIILAGRAFIFTKKNRQDILPINIFGTAFGIGWASALLIMSLSPHILYVNIISSRIVTYTTFPLAIMGAFACTWLIDHITTHRTFALPRWTLSTSLLLILTFICTTGIRDNATSMNSAPQTNSALQTFHVGAYASRTFAEKIAHGDFWMIKDHNYITADTWLKIFFAYDYSYPLSRAFFSRYENNPDRETCTREMISAPQSDAAMTCFDNLHVGAALVNTEQDASQFLKNGQFSRVYENDEHSLFIRTQ